MTRRIIIRAFMALSLLSFASMAQAGCLAEYKAKKDNPLRLRYDMVGIPGPCTVANAQAKLTERLSAEGWTLLTVISVTRN